MESFGAFLDEEFESLSRLFSNPDYNPDFFNSKIPSTASAYENLFLPTDYAFDTNSFFHNVSEESSDCSQIENALFPSDLTNNLFDQSINIYTMDCNKNDGFIAPFPDNLMGEAPPLEAEAGDSCKEMQVKGKNEEAQAIQIQLKPEDYSQESPKKRARVCRNGPKNRRKNKKVIEDKNDKEEINGGTKQSTSSCSSEDDYNASLELNGGSTSESRSLPSLNSNGKARASRGSATDPQSLYARRRRERINERLRILQNLVPNGTKVDISTMLEEAVHYVKFLQLQIKLLSSDDLWMYAPLAYNGMDIGIY